jgi:hypothetical protein
MSHKQLLELAGVVGPDPRGPDPRLPVRNGKVCVALYYYY